MPIVNHPTPSLPLDSCSGARLDHRHQMQDRCRFLSYRALTLVPRPRGGGADLRLAVAVLTRWRRRRSPDARPRAMATRRRPREPRRRVRLKIIMLFFLFHQLIMLMIKIHLLIFFFALQVMSLANQSRNYDSGHQKHRKKQTIMELILLDHGVPF